MRSVGRVFCFGDVIRLVLWLQQAQLFVKCAKQCSHTTFSPASSDNSVTRAAALVTVITHRQYAIAQMKTRRTFLWSPQHPPSSSLVLPVGD